MSSPNQSTRTVACLGCNAKIELPAGPVRATERRQSAFVAFCGIRCNRSYVASEMARTHELNLKEAFHAHYHHPDTAE